MTLVRPEDWKPQGVDDLEDRAIEALRETNRSVCVTAGAGAGKTEFLAQKATYMLQTGICRDPKRILAISFKRDAAETLSERVRKRCPEAQSRRFVSLTFDAFAKGLVDQFRLAIPAQYRPSVDYEISFQNRNQLEDFMQRARIFGINSDQFAKLIEGRRLQDSSQSITPQTQKNIDAYWQDQLYGRGKSYVTFNMINRLAEYLLRTNRRIRKAVRMSYPFVFLDEFQDTRRSQFELLIAAFDTQTTIFTAVGDDKQRIMGWAGAMPDAFNVFKTTFNARSISLLLNWRSHADLVSVQHLVAQRIDPDVECAVARASRTVSGEVSAIWDFEDSEEEVAGIAEWISNEIENGEMQAHEIAILVRNYADAVEEELAPALAEHGIILRNLARNVGSIAIQDLLAEELTEALLPFLRLGSARRDRKSWSKAQRILCSMEAIPLDDEERLQRASTRVEIISKACREYMDANSVENSDALTITSLLINQIGEPVIRRATPSYHRDIDFKRVKNGFVQLLKESMEGEESWGSALDRFEGKNQVPLMTIHKSKGMEFHTIIFFGLDNRSWWSLSPNKPEELNSFFVAFTRAKQRAFFTNCESRGGRITWLENLLGDGVPRTSCS